MKVTETEEGHGELRNRINMRCRRAQLIRLSLNCSGNREPMHLMSQLNDLEAGGGGGGGSNDPLLHKPEKNEHQNLQWKIIRKVYTILSLQMLLTIAISAAVVFVTPVSLFPYTAEGISLLVLLVILIPMVMMPLHYYRYHKPYNLILLGVFTVSISLAVGFACAFINGKVILESAIATAVVLVCLIIYSFQARDRRQDLCSPGPCLFCASVIILLFSVIQILFPTGKIVTMVFGGLASLVFCVYIIYDTDKMIKCYNKEEDYVWLSVMLYLDIISLFCSITNLFKSSNKD